MILQSRFLPSKALYSVALSGLTRHTLPRQKRMELLVPQLYRYEIPCIWYKRRKGVDTANIGVLWDISPVEYEEHHPLQSAGASGDNEMSPRKNTGPLRASAGSYELAKIEKDRLSTALWGDPANLEVYDPRPSQRIEPVGSWVMITRQLPSIEGRIDEHIRVGRIFFAERDNAAGEDGFRLDGTYKIQLNSPWGTVWLWPYEYATIPVNDLIKLWSAEEVIFHPVNIDSARFSEIAFYARTRGIGLADAAVMALGTMTGPVGWFEPRPDLAEECEAMERRVHHPWSARIHNRGSVPIIKRSKKTASAGL